MTGKDKIILQKMQVYISDVLQYIEGFTFESFMADKKTLAACAFTVSQIGELVRGISDETQEKQGHISWKSIRGMRNRIAHDYENIDFEVLWGTVTQSLPDLARKIEVILKECDSI